METNDELLVSGVIEATVAELPPAKDSTMIATTEDDARLKQRHVSPSVTAAALAHSVIRQYQTLQTVETDRAIVCEPNLGLEFAGAQKV